MRKVKNENYIIVLSAVAGIIVFFYRLVRVLALGFKKMGNRLQPAADWFFLSVPGSCTLLLVFAVLTAKCFEQAIVINTATVWLTMLWACLACAIISLAALLLSLIRISREAEFKLKEVKAQ
jgi:hypothetical protein